MVLILAMFTPLNGLFYVCGPSAHPVRRRALDLDLVGLLHRFVPAHGSVLCVSAQCAAAVVKKPLSGQRRRSATQEERVSRRTHQV